MKQVQEEHLCRDIRRIAQGIERIAAALEQLAEERTELAQAALKMARCLRGENPVAGSMDEMTDHIHEEIADVQNVLSILEGTYLYDPHRVARIMEKKMRRWRRRLSRWRRYDS